jgi:MFS family permease
MSTFQKKWFSKTLLGFSITSLLNDFNHEMVTAILPLFIFSTVGKIYAPLAVGLVAGVSNCVRAIANLFGGWLGQKVQNQKKLLLIGYGLTPIFSCLIGTASSLTLILLYRTIAWGARGIRTPIRDAWLVKILSTKDYGKAFGFLRAMDTFGAILGPLVVYFTLMHV